jgi:hypothetical protein
MGNRKPVGLHKCNCNGVLLLRASGVVNLKSSGDKRCNTSCSSVAAREVPYTRTPRGCQNNTEEPLQVNVSMPCYSW